MQKSSGTLYWYGLSSAPLLETSLTGSANFSYYYFNGRITNRRNWVHWNVLDTYVPDALGSTRLVSGWNNAGGSAWDWSDYYPYGGEWAHNYMCCLGNHYKFTGKERDLESGYDNFGARFYSSNLGRFMSPDPVGGWLGNPQSWNAYSMAHNNPVSHTDPSGMCSDDDPSDCIFILQYDPTGGGGTLYEYGQAAGPIMQTGGPISFGPPIRVWQWGGGGMGAPCFAPCVASKWSTTIPAQSYPADGSIMSQLMDPQQCPNCRPILQSANDWIEFSLSASPSFNFMGGEIIAGLPYGSRVLEALMIAEAAPRLQRRGLLDLNKINKHHRLPQQHRDFFEAPGRNIDIDSPEFIKEYPRYKHEDIHSGLYNDGVRYNEAWADWIDEHPQATREEVIEELLIFERFHPL